MIPQDIARKLNVSNPVFIEATQIAEIWKVVLPDGGFAALKIYKGGDMRNERPGFAFMSGLGGSGGAKVLGLTKGEALLEWLEGPSLGDLTRQGSDLDACDRLVSLANQIHAERRIVKGELPKLDVWFTALLDLRFGPELAPSAVDDLLLCKDVARHLLASQVDVRPLHGDLHHDNIRRGDRGYCAFDAKGILGERAFELANAFRNPKGAADVVRDPERVRRVATTWSYAFGVDRRRLLEWAMVKVALSISWRSGPILTDDPELGFLSIVRGVLDPV